MPVPQLRPSQRSGRAARSWGRVWRWAFAVVVGAAASAVQYGTVVDEVGPDGPDAVGLAVLMALDVVAAPVALVLLAWRRRPVPAAAVILLSSFSALSVGAGVIAAVSFAATQSLRRVVAVGIAFTVLATSASWLVPGSESPSWGVALAVAAVYAVLALIGLYVRNRRQLVASLQAQARSTRAEQQALAETARSLEQARIAREMHDALGHQLSLIAMHAGALESRDDLSPEDTRTAAGVVRQSAHLAMDELRQVLGVLNHASTRSDGSDLPTLVQLDELLDTGIGSGVVPDFRCEIDVDALPPTLSRHLYRLAQEALTNVRKHAPGQPTVVLLHRLHPGAVELVVRNRLADRPDGAQAAARSEHVHHGLTGMAERARLAGGSITAGPEASEFVVRAVLPCQG